MLYSENAKESMTYTKIVSISDCGTIWPNLFDFS